MFPKVGPKIVSYESLGGPCQSPTGVEYQTRNKIIVVGNVMYITASTGNAANDRSDSYSTS